jgi:hypothetical protein
MLSPLPRRSDWASSLLIHPAVSAFPDRVVGSACASTFSRFARRSLALRPAHSRCHQFVTRITEGFNRFVTSTIAPVASGWSICRVGLTPTGKRHLFTAHTRSGPSNRHPGKVGNGMQRPLALLPTRRRWHTKCTRVARGVDFATASRLGSTFRPRRFVSSRLARCTPCWRTGSSRPRIG